MFSRTYPGDTGRINDNATKQGKQVAVKPSVTANDYAEFCAFLEDACGIVLGANKDYLLASRLGTLMDEHQLTSTSELVARAKGAGSSQLRQRIVDAMTTNETLWFRDTHPYEILREQILPKLAEARADRIRIWSAACSSGEEPYSISMVVEEFKIANPGKLFGDVEIVATDISSSVLARAQEGLYEERGLTRGLSSERRARFFAPEGDRWRIRENIRSRVSFRRLNLMESYATLGKFDIIFCRNVLIYFSSESKADILQRMARGLNPRGHLLLGGSESVANYSDDFEMVRCNPGVIYRLKNYTQAAGF